MGDVNLGSIKAKLELEADDLKRQVEQATELLKKLGANAEQTKIFLAEMAKAVTEGGGAGMIAALQQQVDALEQLKEKAKEAKGFFDGFGESFKKGITFGGAFEIGRQAAGLLIDTIKDIPVAMADAVVAVAEYSEKMEKAAFSTGLSTDALQGLEKASTAAGIGSDGLLRSIQRLEVAAGNDSKAFANLGLSLKEVRDASPEELLGKVMDKLIPMADIAERNAQAQKLLGRSFADAAIAYREYEAGAASYINLTTEQLAAGKEMDSALDSLKTAWGELGKEVGAALNTPEIREGMKALAGAIRDIVIEVKNGEGPIAFFFKMISTAAGTAAKDLVFLGGVIDGIKERMASVNKDTPGAIARGMEALDAFQKKIDATANRDLGNKLFPNLGTDLDAIHKKFNPSEGPDRSKEIEAEQKRQETIAALLQKARTSAAIEGKKIMDAQFKEAEKHVKDGMRLTLLDKKEREEAERQYLQTERVIGQQSTDILQARLRDGTLTFKQEWDLRKGIIISANQEHIDAINKVLAATTDPGQRAALEALANDWRHITEEELKAAETAERYASIQHTLSGLSDVLSGLGDLFTMLGGKADSTFGRIIAGAQGAVSSIQSIVSGAQGFGAAAAKGDILGMISSGIGVATGVVGVVKSIVSVFHKPEFKKIMNDVGKSWGVSISEGLAKEIEQIAKANKISRSLAELLDVSKIIGESGKDPREFTAKISDLMNAIKSGAVPAAQGLAELGKAFNQVAEAALKSGNIGDKALVGLLKRARELGQVTPEMKEFVAGQLSSAVEGVQKLIEVMPPETAAKAGSSGALLAATFNAIAAEQGILAASAALGPAYDSLMGQISKAGLAIPEALQSIGRQMELGRKPEFAAASQAAAATSQVLTGLGNAGYMDTSVLGASADVAKQTFDQAKNAGATDKEAYQLIGSLLSDIKNASIQSGQELSGVAQELISGAQAEGVVIQGDQLSVLVDIRNILAGGGYTPGGGATGTGGGFGGTSAETGGITGAGDVFTAPPSATYHERELRHFAGGSYGVQDFGAGTPAILHGREAVVTEKQMSNMGGGISFHPVFMTDAIQTNESRADLSKFQIDEFVRQVINNPLFQQILRDQGLRG